MGLDYINIRAKVKTFSLSIMRLNCGRNRKILRLCRTTFNQTRSLYEVATSINTVSDVVASNDLNSDATIDQEVAFSFIEVANGNKRVDVKGKVGRSLLHIAINHGVDLDSACGGVLVCSTCHVIAESEIFNILPPQEEDETDMLDLAAGVTTT